MRRALCSLVAAATLATCGEAPPRARSVLLITLDTTRADALGCYGARPAVTPRIDELAARGLVFDAARTVTPTTLPAHASMLTGLYPNRHGVRDNSLNALPQAADTVAERARAAGFHTAAFVSALVLDRAFGLAQGFETYSQPARAGDVAETSNFSTRSARATAEEAARWLEQLPAGEPCFAWVHFFDPHQPYTAEPRFVQRARGNPYLAEVAATDEALGTLLDALERSGRGASTAIIVVGDHGESLGEHGEPGHADFCFDSTLRVPLIICRPDGARAGERSSAIVSVADIASTVCEALDVPNVEGDGASLWEALPDATRGVYFESYYAYLRYGMAPLAGWVDAQGKYIHTSEPEFYDPARFPKERKNLIDERALDVPRYRARIAEIAARAPLAGEAGARPNAALLRSVSELGYAQASAGPGPLPDPLAASDLPSPHRCAEELEACRQGQNALIEGRFEDSQRILGELLAAHPRNAAALEFRALALSRLGRFDESRALLERALELGPERAPLHRALGVLLQRLQRPDEARAHWQRAVELDPSDIESLGYLLADALARGDAPSEARLRAQLKLAASE